MKKIVILTKTLTRYNHIRTSLQELSKGSFEITNSFYPVKKLLTFKRNHFFQIFFPTPDLLIIDEEIRMVSAGGHETLFQKISGFNIISPKTKVIVLINNKSENKSKFPNTFIFNENAKAEDKVLDLFLKIKEI